MIIYDGLGNDYITLRGSSVTYDHGLHPDIEGSKLHYYTGTIRDLLDSCRAHRDYSLKGRYTLHYK